MDASRLTREATFHDRVFTQRSRAAAGKFYAAATSARQHYERLIHQCCLGKQVLEYGCGAGSHAFDLAHRGASVTGIDISAAGIDLARRRAAEEGLENRLSLQVMDAEELAFPEHHFDLVCGSGILHHLDLQRALAALTRVLKTEGQAVFFEPLGHNPLVNLYRRLTPGMRSVDEHPLRDEDLRTIAARFEQTEFQFFCLCSLLAVPFRSLPGFGMLLKLCETVDRRLFALPALRKQAWIVVARLSGPRTGR